MIKYVDVRIERRHGLYYVSHQTLRRDWENDFLVTYCVETTRKIEDIPDIFRHISHEHRDFHFKLEPHPFLPKRINEDISGTKNNHNRRVARQIGSRDKKERASEAGQAKTEALA